MKKYVQLYNDSTGLPLTGKAIRLINDVGGTQVDLAERGTSGVYRASSIIPGVYSVWDVTNPGVPIDLDQKVDVLSSLAVAFPTSSDANKFYRGGTPSPVFDTVTSDLVKTGPGALETVTVALAAKEPGIATGDTASAWFGNKVFRPILKSDLSWFDEANADLGLNRCVFSDFGFAENTNIGTSDISGRFTFDIIELRQSESYLYKISFVDASGREIITTGGIRIFTFNFPSVTNIKAFDRFVAFARRPDGVNVGIQNSIGDDGIVNVSAREYLAISDPDYYASGKIRMTFGARRGWVMGEGISFEMTGVLNG